MKDVLFYKTPEGNVIARQQYHECCNGVGPETIKGYTPDPGCPSVSKGWFYTTYLREQCIRISEEEARELHPHIFEYMQTHDWKI